MDHRSDSARRWWIGALAILRYVVPLTWMTVTTLQEPSHPTTREFLNEAQTLSCLDRRKTRTMQPVRVFSFAMAHDSSKLRAEYKIGS